MKITGPLIMHSIFHDYFMYLLLLIVVAGITRPSQPKLRALYIQILHQRLSESMVEYVMSNTNQ